MKVTLFSPLLFAIAALGSLTEPASGHLSGTINLADIGGAVPGVTFRGIDPDDFSGFAAASAGDFNGDGMDDLLIAAPYADPGGEANAGETYLVYGRTGLAGGFDLAAADITFRGVDPFDGAGVDVSSAGDVNGDGLADLLIGAPHAGDFRFGSNPGETYLIYGRGNLAGNFDLAAANATFRGIDPGDLSGYSISSAGDFNGDGFADLLIGADFAEPTGDYEFGETYLVYGGPNLAGRYYLATAAVTYRGITPFDHAGDPVSSAGDFNGDGFADVLIAAYAADPNGDSLAGETYLIYGRATLAGIFDFTAADVTFRGIDPGDHSGASVSSAGDFNGDGYADLLIGANLAEPNGDLKYGETYLVYGRPSLVGGFDLAKADVTFHGIAPFDYSGFSVATAGDVNGDGLSDLLVSAINASPDGEPGAGECYLVYGRVGLTGGFNLAAADVTFRGINDGDIAGFSVSSAGDFNGDGMADFLIGANHATANGVAFAGETYLVYGQEIPEPTTVALAALSAMIATGVVRRRREENGSEVAK